MPLDAVVFQRQAGFKLFLLIFQIPGETEAEAEAVKAGKKTLETVMAVSSFSEKIHAFDLFG